MERKTKIDAEDGRFDLTITREFDLPVMLVFRAHAEPELIEQWMGTNVLEFEAKTHGGWKYETRDSEGNVVFTAHGIFHEFVDGEKIVRTFQMTNAPFGVQLEEIKFEALTSDTSRLTIHSVYQSQELRDQMLKLPFAFGINMAHDRLQEIIHNLK